MHDAHRICQFFQQCKWHASEMGVSWLELLVWFELKMHGPLQGTSDMLVDALVRVFKKRVRAVLQERFRSEDVEA
eukprot:2788753-Alexandrium_andersonii.AAC.1